MAGNSLIYSFVGIGGIAAIAYFFSSGKLSNIGSLFGKVITKDDMHVANQERIEKEIKSVEEKQTVVMAKLIDSEKLSPDVQKKIRDKVDQAANDIQVILKENDVKTINKEFDSAWKDLSSQ